MAAPRRDREDGPVRIAAVASDGEGSYPTKDTTTTMRDVSLYMSMSLDGFVASDREHPGMATPEGAELKQWKLDRISKAGAHLMGRVTYQEMSSYWPQSDDRTRPR
jgi:hypothetical protein